MTSAPRDARPFGARGTRIYDGFGYLGGLLLAIMVLAVFGQVLIRRFFMFSIDGIEEVPSKAARATLALKPGTGFRRGRFIGRSSLGVVE